MAQDFAPLLRSIWSDPDWRALSMDAQHVYEMLLSHPDRNAAGLLPLTMKKWTRLARDLTEARLEVALEELDSAGFIVLDAATEEVLVRAFIRRGGVYKHVRMLVNALRQASEIESPRLRSAIGQELVRLPRVAIPSTNSKMADEAERAQQELDDLASMLCDAPPEPPGRGAGQGSDHGMSHGMAHGIAHGSVVGAGVVAGVGAGAVGGLPLEEDDLSALEVDAHASTLTGLCRTHWGQPARTCTGCAIDRRAAS